MSQRSPSTPRLTPVFMPGLVLPRQSSLSFLSKVFAAVKRGCLWIASAKAQTDKPNRLQLIDRVAVGEKNYLFVAQVDGRRFLIGGGQAAPSLLAELKSDDTFHDVLRSSTAVAKPRSRKQKVSDSIVEERSL